MRGKRRAVRAKWPRDVGAELQLEGVGGLKAFGRRHDAGVVDEEIERLVLAEEPLGELADVCQRGEIEQDKLGGRAGGFGVQAGQGCLSAGAVAAGEQDVRSLSCQPQRGVIADAAVGSGDEGATALLGGDVLDRPFAHERLDAWVWAGSLYKRDSEFGMGERPGYS